MREKEKERREQAWRNHWSQEEAVTRRHQGRNPRPQTLAPDFIHLIYVLLDRGGEGTGEGRAVGEGAAMGEAWRGCGNPVLGARKWGCLMGGSGLFEGCPLREWLPLIFLSRDVRAGGRGVKFLSFIFFLLFSNLVHRVFFNVFRDIDFYYIFLPSLVYGGGL